LSEDLKYVIKASTVPLRGPNDDPLLTERISAEDLRNKWLNICSRLKEFLQRCRDAIKEREGAPPLNTPEDLHKIASAISLFFRIPLIKEVAKNVRISPFKLLLAYILTKDTRTYGDLWVRFEKGKGDIRDIIGDFRDLILQDPFIRRIFELLDDDELFVLLEWAMTRIPADTRPGANTTSLIIHLLTTAAVAWAEAKASNFNEFETAIVRLAGLLHDVGKPLDFKRHVERSKDLARELLQGIIENSIIDKICSMIEAHHEISRATGDMRRLVTPLKVGDETSAATDRLNDLIKNFLGAELVSVCKDLVSKGVIISFPEAEKGDIEGTVRVLYGGGKEVWALWESIGYDVTERLSKKFVEELRRSIKEGTLPGVGRQRARTTKYKIYKIDLAGIQRMVYSAENLAIVQAGSYFVDFTISFFIPFILMSRRGTPAEAIIYAAGGNVLFLELADFDKRILDEGTAVLKKYYPELRIRLASSEIYEFFPLTMQKLEKRIALEKASEAFAKDRPLMWGLERFCRLCWSKPAKSRRFDILCEYCERKWLMGNELTFREKWENAVLDENMKPANAFGNIEWQWVSRNVIEVLAGHEPEELMERRPERYLNYAVVRVDGNLMGKFMSESISLSDMVTRSYRIDISLKKALFKAIEIIKKTSRNGMKDASRIIVGVLYAGGDDACFIMPSWLAIPVSILLAEEFRREMGGDVTLSIGIAAAPSKHSIWMLIDAALALEGEAKRRGRDVGSGGAIAFDFIEQGILSGGSVRDRLSDAASQGLSCQPYVLSTDYGDGVSIYEPISILLGIDLPPKTGKLDNYYEILFRRFSDVFYSTKNKNKSPTLDRVRRIRGEIQNILNAVKPFGQKPHKPAFTYCAYNYARLGRQVRSERASIILGIMHLMAHQILQRDEIVPLTDLYTLVKFSGGGYL